MDENRRILMYEVMGIPFIILLGSLFHFTFELSGNHAIVGVFSAVNESVWEHLKLGYWPALAYAIFEYRYMKKSTNGFMTAKAVGIYTIPTLIIIFFYTYTVFLEDLLILDILTFILAVIIGQLISYKLLTLKRSLQTYEKLSLIPVIVLGLAFVIFTFYPPRLPIFQDPITGGYGILHH
ncbi:MAG: hypothetical protein JSV35_05955 [Candidatus Bathyarchaeota archaeon]|nr:MAG: hypothetical protein JSV35_05955 [Candidatus Bathyarchaeota archaeon]